jgi:hypothetical protein
MTEFLRVRGRENRPGYKAATSRQPVGSTPHASQARRGIGPIQALGTVNPVPGTGGEPPRRARHPTLPTTKERTMQATIPDLAPSRYAKVIETSRRVRWEIERDLIRGRRFDYTRSFLPSGLSLVDELDFLGADDKRLLSQVQGRTYAYIFGLVERYIAAKTLELGQAQAFGDQVAMEALVRMTDEEIKHQELFRRLETMMAADMPAGYVMTADPNAVAQAVLSKCNWAVLALTLHIELFTQAHYRASIEPDPQLSELWKDVFLFHWKEESQHAVLDELELLREDARLDKARRDAAVEDLIALVGAVDGILQAQAKADSTYFCAITGNGHRAAAIEAGVLKAYRWQYIVSGVMEPRFQKVLFGLVDPQQAARIQAALEPLTAAVPARREARMAMPA